MVVLGVVIAIVCFLYLSLRALLQATRERRNQERSACKKLPRISYEVIDTLGVQLKQINKQGKISQAGQDCVAELKEEQPFLFVLLVEILKQEGKEDLQDMAPAFIVYKLLKAQIEADLLDRSLRH